jgi:calcium permeable stress-gated cation channel
MAVWKADHHDVLRQNGMDAYVFLRFLRMMIKIFLPIWLISWAVLLPTTSVNATGGRQELDMVPRSASSVPPSINCSAFF